MKIAKKALILIAWLPPSNMTTYGTVLQRRAAAFAALARNRSPGSTPARQRHQHARPPVASSQIPFPLSSSSIRQKKYLIQRNQPMPFSMCRQTNSMIQLFMASDDDGDSSETNEDTRRTFNLPILKKETTRMTLRTHKKIGKAVIRLRAAEEQYEKLCVAIDASPPDEEMDETLLQKLEQAPNVEQHRGQLKDLQTRLRKLNWLEEQFAKSPLKGKKTFSAEDMQKLIPEGKQVVQYIQELDISDDESKKQKNIEQNARNRRAKKEKSAQLKDKNQQQQGPRLPYRRYYTEQQVEIRVGKQASDNDVLSLSPEHRSGSHWWYHASGCPGSHVVLCTDAASPSDEDVLDAASLAALKSKCIGQSVIKVSMTRARNVSKPPGAKPGLVQLNGNVKTITVRKSEVENRCKRLEETVIIN